MRISRGAAFAAIIVTAGCAATLVAQTSDTSVGSLRELTGEIRQLRFAIEQSTRTQTQAQALGILLSAQQSRILQVTTRLDAARKELDAVGQQSIHHTNELAMLDEAILKISDPNERAAVEDRSKGLKLEMKSMAAQEQQARTREAEMVQAWQQEEARWNDLIARLHQIVEQ
jgi:hypothetical protein